MAYIGELINDDYIVDFSKSRAKGFYDAKEAFRAAILKNLGFAPKEVVGDSEFHRFATSKRGRDDAGYYKYFDDEFPSGFYGNWRTGEQFSWSAREVSEMSPIEREHFEQVKAERERRDAEKRAEAIAGAQKRWNDAAPAKADHPYLARKGIQAHGAREENGRLLVPINIKGEPCSIQSIAADGAKKYHYGAPVARGYFAIDAEGDTIVICEGFATGATIHEATGLSVLVAFTASNLEPITRLVRNNLPGATIIVAADDDRKTETERGTNPGLRAAHKAAEAVGAIVAVPPFDRESDGEAVSDWNDYALLRGVDATKEAFQAAQDAGREAPQVGPDGEQAPGYQRAKQRETIFADGDVIDPETGEILREASSASDEPASGTAEEMSNAQEAFRQKPGAQHGVQVEIVIASEFAGKPVPPQEWHVDGVIPANNVTGLGGDGGTGKSLLGLQLGVATATNGLWIGFRPKAGKVLFVSAEDEIEELHRRLARICPRLETLDNLAIIPLAGKDAVLAAPEGSSGLLKETPLFKAIRHIIAKHRPDLLILDTLADLFGGDEIKKVQARQFIGLLRGLALEYRVTVLLLYHPSQAGMNSGSGTSGNSAWNNSVRSRLYFERRITREGSESFEDDVNIRVLKTMKSNRAAIGGQIVVRYDKGMFVREQESTLDARDAAHQAERAFMELLAQFERECRTVSDKSGPNYAPFVFSKHPGANGIQKGQLEKAMNRLFGDNRIKVEETGPMSRRQRKIVVVNPASDCPSHAEDETPIEETERPPDDTEEEVE
jgi:phage/plasmid primase-like uncharacterized protein/RecA-family ATPase